MFKQSSHLVFQNDQTASGGMSTQDPVPYHRFLELLNAKNESEQARDALAADLKTLQATGDTERATASKQLADLTTALQSEKQTALRLRVAMLQGLPLDLAARLVGSDETELTADAERLAGFLKPASPGVPPPSGGGTLAAIDIARMTPAQIRAARAEGKIKLGS